MLSKRAEVARDWEDFLVKHLNMCVADPYDAKDNPLLTSDDVWSCDTNLLQYREVYGIMRLREVFAKVITVFFETHVPVSPENLICVTGVTSCIDLMAHCLGDPGDVFLVPSPMYGRIYTNFKQRSLINIWPIPIITANNNEDFPVLTLEKVITAYEHALKADKVVRGVFLINPNNPLGDLYSPQLLMDIMSFCHAHSLHIIVDEVYALSVFSKTQKFQSILKFCKLPDPDRTHILYGISKDFGLAGLRVGAIYTTCEPLKKCLLQLSFFQCIPFPVMEITAKYLEDLEWLRMYVGIYQQRLAENFEYCMKYLKGIGLKVRDSPAGFFLWVDFRHLCKSADQEKEFFNYLIEKEHLYICPGEEFFCAQPGWFRIIFTESLHHLTEGLSRLARATKEYKPSDI